MKTKALTITNKVTLRDVLSMLKYSYAKSPAKYLVFLEGIFFAYVGGTGLLHGLSVDNLFICLLGIVLISYPYIVLTYLANKIYKKSPFYSESFLFSFNNDGIVYGNSDVRTEIAWELVTDYKVQGNYLFLEVSGCTPVTLNKQHIASDIFSDLLGLVSKKVIAFKGKPVSRMRKFFRGLLFGIVFLLVEIDLFWGLVVYAVLSKDVDKVAQGFSGIYVLLALAIPVGLFFLRRRKYFYPITIIFLVVILAITSYIFAKAMQHLNEQKAQAQQEEMQSKQKTKLEAFTGDELWKAVNEKRVQFGTEPLEKNTWACKVADLYLRDNLKIGNGYFVDNDDYQRVIGTIIQEYKDADIVEKTEPMPEFDYQYSFYSMNLKDGIDLLVNDKDEKEVFTQRTITNGCAAAKKGYGVIVTAEDPLYNPTLEKKKSKTTLPDNYNTTENYL